MADQFEKTLTKCAPKGLTGVTTMLCGTTSNEHAFKAVFKAFMNKERGYADVSSDEIFQSNENNSSGTRYILAARISRLYYL